MQTGLSPGVLTWPQGFEAHTFCQAELCSLQGHGYSSPTGSSCEWGSWRRPGRRAQIRGMCTLGSTQREELATYPLIPGEERRICQLSVLCEHRARKDHEWVQPWLRCATMICSKEKVRSSFARSLTKYSRPRAGSSPKFLILQIFAPGAL
jgi:hypothetical protein